ncbi:MAG: exosortase-associated EpsI family protein [Verrucomicrobiia bacterium]
MNLQNKTNLYLLTAIAAAMIVGSGVLLGYLQANQRLSPAPVKVVAEPMPGVDSAATAPDKKNFIAGTNRVYLPEKVDGFVSQLIPVERAEYETLPKDTVYGRRLYRSQDGFEIVNMVVLMGADRTSIHKPQYCLEGTGWRIDSTEKVFIPMEKPFPYQLPVTKLNLSGYLVGNDGQKQLRKGVFLYWFVAENELTADHKSRMWSVALHRVKKGEIQRWAYVIYFSTCLPGEEEAVFERMKAFIKESLPEYQVFPKLEAVVKNN